MDTTHPVPLRVVVALGGNALLKRGEPMTADVQRANVRTAAQQLAPVALKHDLVLSHGNGPQVGLLALQAAAYEEVEAYPLDVLGAQTEGMIGYVIEQELGNLLPFEKPLATVLTMVEVDPDDPAFDDPTKFVGPVSTTRKRRTPCSTRRAGPSSRTATTGVVSCRRRSPSRSSSSTRSAGCSRRRRVVICAGGGGVPTMYDRADGAHAHRRRRPSSTRTSPPSCWLAKLEADLLVMATDVDGVYADWGTPEQRLLSDVTPEELREPRVRRQDRWGPRSRRPSVSSDRTGKRAAIG